MKRAVLYLRVEQTTANQDRELRKAASRMGCEIVHVYKDHGISGAKGREKRPAFDRMCRDAAQRKFDIVMAWSVDRLGRSLQDLVSVLSELHALRVDLFLPGPRHHDTGRQGHVPDDGLFAEFEGAMIQNACAPTRRLRTTGWDLPPATQPAKPMMLSP